MSEITAAIQEKLREIARLKKQIESLQEAEEILQGYAKKKEEPRSQPQMAAAILDEVGKPMHVSIIAEQMKKRYQQTVKVANLGVMLFRYSKRLKTFYKVKGKPNTYGLSKWETTNALADKDKGIEKYRAAS